MPKDHEHFLLKCELAKTMLMKVWVKGFITDEKNEKNRWKGIETFLMLHFRDNLK